MLKSESHLGEAGFSLKRDGRYFGFAAKELLSYTRLKYWVIFP
jgi:hypothetical protein